MKRGPLKVFYSYAHEDEWARDALDEHLELLARRNLVLRWHDRHIVPGSEWGGAIQEALDSADIILLLVSRAFMASRYVRENEIPSAMAVHSAGHARVVPILLEDVPGWRETPFGCLEVLPTKGRAISRWRDPVSAYADVTRGIERVAKDIIIAGGGPFEFGAHEFSEAELSSLRPGERKRCNDGLLRLRKALNASVPPRHYERNLLLANWTLREFGKQPLDRHLPESLFYMAQVITAFDLVALQEVQRNLTRLEALLDILGPDWSYLMTDVAPGIRGNGERFVILYYTPRVEFRHFSSNLILPPDPAAGTQQQAAEQLARPPLLAAFRSGGWEFHVCTTHIVFGGAQGAVARTVNEVNAMGRYFRRRVIHDQPDLLLMGDFNYEHPGSPVFKALTDIGAQLPEAVVLPAHSSPNRYYSLIGFVSQRRQMPLADSNPPAGVVRIFEHVLRDEDKGRYVRTPAFRARRLTPGTSGSQFHLWRTLQMSDHFPLWVELALPMPV